MASLSVSLCCWSYRRSLSRRSRASGLIKHLFSLWVKFFQRFHECCPQYCWSVDLGLCDTYSDSHVAPLYPEPWQCEQAETQNKLTKSLSTELTGSPQGCWTKELEGFHITTFPGNRYRSEPRADRQQTHGHEVHMNAHFQNAFKRITQLMTIIF